MPYEECLALLDLWLYVFLRDIDSSNVYLCTTLDSMDVLLAVRPSMFADITIGGS